MKPSVSVIIPTHNRSLELKRAIDSVLAQTIQDFEILVCDDASSEDIQAVCDSYTDSRIRCFRTEKKGNANIQRNIGIENSNGDFIAYLDSDDEWEPEHLEIKLNKIHSSNSDGVYGGIRIYSNPGQTFIRYGKQYDNSILEYIFMGGTAQTSTLVFKNLNDDIIKWDSSLLRHQDYDYLHRFCKQNSLVFESTITTIVNTNLSGKEINYNECFRFYKTIKKEVSVKARVSYLLGMFKFGNSIGDKAFTNLYRSEILKYIQYISFIEFIQLNGHLNSFGKVKVLINYYFRLSNSILSKFL